MEDLIEYTQKGLTVLMNGKELTIDEVVDLLNTNEKLLAERQRILGAIPDCPTHGKDCVPHAISWIKRRIR